MLAILLASCVKNEVTLSFTLPKDVNTPCRIVYYASGRNAGMLRETVVEIAQGKGEITLPQQYPGLIFLFSPSGRQPSVVIYAKRGEKFKISGQNANMAQWSVEGNKVSEELAAWRKENETALSSGSADAGQLNKAVADYVKKHPESSASAIILYLYFQRKDHEKEFAGLYNSLGATLVHDPRLEVALSVGDLLGGIPEAPHLPRRIVLTGLDGFADTVSLSAGKGNTLLVFRKAGNASDTDVETDSLKALLSRKKRGVVAELHSEPDSMAWRRVLRRDTIEGMKRLWLPLGLADSVAIKMGVRRLPFYIVIDSKGKETYRGDDWNAAARKFEN